MSKSKSSESAPDDGLEGEVVYLSLGSNVGERMEFLQEAINAIHNSPEIEIQKQSAVYETQPLEDQDQDEFLNMIVELTCAQTPGKLLKTLQSIENDLGRKRRREKGPREIDIDIVFFGDQVVEQKNLNIPHPKAEQRKFVLFPLSHLNPDFISPSHNKSVAELLHECPDESYIHLYGHLNNA